MAQNAKNSLHVASICLMFVATGFGIAAAVLTASAWNKLDLHAMWMATVLCLPGLLICAAVAYPLAFCAAARYKRQGNNNTSTPGQAGRCLMITAWVFYGFMILILCGAIYLGLLTALTTVGAIIAVIISLLGGYLMNRYADLAHKAHQTQYNNNGGYVHTAPSTTAAAKPADTETGGEATADSSATTVTESNKPDGSKTITTETTHPDGSKTVTVQEIVAVPDEEMATPPPEQAVTVNEETKK